VAAVNERAVAEHTISIVVPVYQGEHTLDTLIEELRPLTKRCCTPQGRPMRVAEVILVHDGGPDRSDVVIRRLVATTPFVRPVWLSRNFGQHAATIAGMSSTGSEWIVTMDEDGQFDPGDIGRMLDVALEDDAQLVYGTAKTPPHGLLRNLASRVAKAAATLVLADGSLVKFSSFRLMLGEIGRGAAAYVGPGVFLDAALSWTFGRTALCPVQFRQGSDRPSGYSFRKLLSHFWQLVITMGPRPLRLVSLTGVVAGFAGVVLALVLIIEKLAGHVNVPGWTSVTVIVLLLGGMNLLAVGVVAEYVGAAVRMAMGKPLYLITADPRTGPLHRDASDAADPLAVE
jgi:undecaprenyl-phosphate 4-deoxy-4-formamido-L-arabinose transferase